MTSRSEPTRRRDAGTTLIEMLAVLAILGLALALVAGGRRPPSDRIALRAEAARLVEAASAARLGALAGGRTQEFRPEIAAPARRIACPGGTATGALVFQPDGSVAGRDICLAQGAARLQVEVDWLTGLLRPRDP